LRPSAPTTSRALHLADRGVRGLHDDAAHLILRAGQQSHHRGADEGLGAGGDRPVQQDLVEDLAGRAHARGVVVPQRQLDVLDADPHLAQLGDAGGQQFAVDALDPQVLGAVQDVRGQGRLVRGGAVEERDRQARRGEPGRQRRPGHARADNGDVDGVVRCRSRIHRATRQRHSVDSGVMRPLFRSARLPAPNRGRE
jgi:hypothetical protein